VPGDLELPSLRPPFPGIGIVSARRHCLRGADFARFAIDTMSSEAIENPSRDQAGSGAARECALIEADLERLKSLIKDAGDRLLVSFNQVAAMLPGLSGDETQRSQVDQAVRAAVTALQFQDMATQLTGLAQRRLSVLEERLRRLSGEAARSPEAGTAHPVRQVEMSAGSIDLF